MSTKRVRIVSVLGLLVAAACASGGRPPVRYDVATTELRQSLEAALAARSETRLAVLPLEAEGDVARSVGGLVVDDFSAALAKSPGVTLVERSKMEAILKEIALQQSGILRDEDEIKMGQMAGAQVLLAVRATLLGDRIAVNARLMDIASGEAITGLNLDIQYDDALRSAVADRAARLNVRTSEEVLAAFGKLRAGDYAAAEEVFEPLSKEEGERRSVGTMGLAAVALARGQGAKATELCQVSQQLSDAPSYCWVVQGKLAYDQGRVEEANDPLVRAMTDEGTLIDWQKAQAANLLGLVAMAKDDIDTAIAHYDKAIALDPSNSEALSNKARILEEKGDLDTAIKLYQQGVKNDPDDQVLALLLRDAEMRLTFARDREQQAKIASLAEALVSQKSDQAKPKGDGWSSAPYAVTLLPLEEKGTPSARLGETEFLESSLRGSLDELSGVSVVDRELLNKVLEELQISGSSLGDQSTALKVGKVMAAKVLLGGTIVRMGEESQLTLKLVETETTRVLATVTEFFERDERLSKVGERVAAALRKKLIEVLPVRGVVMAAKGKRSRINVGSNLGVKNGDSFRMLHPKSGSELGRARVVEVAAESSWIEAESGKAAKGSRVERLVAGDG